MGKKLDKTNLSYRSSLSLLTLPKLQINRPSDIIIYVVPVANRGTTAGSSGDEIGKALASVSSFVCC